MLLGQAESGKSTLQKQFQLYYSSQSLDWERPSWRPIVYSNILKAIRTIFNELDHQFTVSTTRDTSPESEDPVTSSSYFPAVEPGASSWPTVLQDLKIKLAPLVESEDALASELSGGITVSGGRTGVYVRAGWQALITPNRAWPVSDIREMASRPTVVSSRVAKTLLDTQAEITGLWQHPTVRKLVKSNRIRLEESAALCVRLMSSCPIIDIRGQLLGPHTKNCRPGISAHYRYEAGL